MEIDVSAEVTRSTPDPGEAGDYLEVSKLRKQYLDYASVKRDEIDEQRQSRHYYHGDQWSRKEIKTLEKRKQPVVTSNRVSRKIDGVIGLVERLRQDPKAFPRTPKHEDGAEIGTAALRYALDAVEWQAIRAECDRNSAINGLAGIELSIEQNEDTGDSDIGLASVDPDTFFYDPRSFKHDFSDARFEGVAKWIDKDAAKEMFRDKGDLLDGLFGGSQSSETFAQQDRERKWVDSENDRVFLIEHWYRHKGGWCWCFYVGGEKLHEGRSLFTDEKGAEISRFIMYSANVDHDGDRYGFVRNLKSAQDEVNHRRSKALFELNSRRVIAEQGAVQDIEKARREYARPDGWVEVNPGRKLEGDDAKKQADFKGQLEMLQEAKTEIENFGPNPALIGQGVENKSGRAIQLLQQAGIAELGPFIIAQRGWKIRVYRAMWSAMQRYWTAERWVRVTDDEGVAQFIKVNGLATGMDGMPALENAIGSLDMDIILDEGPDTINMMADTFDTLTALAQQGAAIPPQVIVELSQLPGSTKKRILDLMTKAQQPGPEAEITKQLAIEDAKAKIGKTKADALKSLGSAMQTMGQALRPEMAEGVTGMEPAAVPAGPEPMPMPMEQPQFMPPQGPPQGEVPGGMPQF